jgi:hypothetical protein
MSRAAVKRKHSRTMHWKKEYTTDYQKGHTSVAYGKVSESETERN